MTNITEDTRMTRRRYAIVPRKPCNDWEQMLKRFATSLSECRAIDEHISECRILMVSCRAAETANFSDKELRVMLALHLQQCSFIPAHPDDLDCIGEYLDAVQRGNNKLMFAEENAVNAVMRLPFAVTMLPEDTEELDRTISAIVNRAEKTIRTADKLSAEFATAGMVCDIVDAIENSARAGRKLTKKFEEICVKVSKSARRGAKQGAREGVIKYNEAYILNGKTPYRKKGGGRKAGLDINGLQCAALLVLGKEYRNGKANPPAHFTDYADRIIRTKFPMSDKPFVYPAGGSSREKSKVRTMLLKRFDTYLKHQSPPKTRDKALPLAGASE